MRCYKKHGNDLIPMTRERMIFDLTQNELEWLVDWASNRKENNLPSNVHGLAEFFSAGGFNAYSDERLERAHDQIFPADEATT